MRTAIDLNEHRTWDFYCDNEGPPVPGLVADSDFSKLSVIGLEAGGFAGEALGFSFSEIGTVPAVGVSESEFPKLLEIGVEAGGFAVRAPPSLGFSSPMFSVIGAVAAGFRVGLASTFSETGPPAGAGFCAVCVSCDITTRRTTISKFEAVASGSALTSDGADTSS